MVGPDNFNPRYINAEVEVRAEVIVKEIIIIGTDQKIDQIVGIEDSSGKIVIDTDLSKVIEEIIPKTTPEGTIDKIAEEHIGIIIIEMMVTTEVGTGLEKDHFQEIMALTELGVQVIVG